MGFDIIYVYILFHNNTQHDKCQTCSKSLLKRFTKLNCLAIFVMSKLFVTRTAVEKKISMESFSLTESLAHMNVVYKIIVWKPFFSIQYTI